MQFQYGSYFHDVNSVFFKAIQREFVRGETGRQHLARTHWNLEGKIVRRSMSEIMQALSDLQLAYSIDGQIAAMLDNNGTPTNFLVDSAQTVGGVRVTNPISHEVVSGAHGVTYLKYSLGLTWDVLWAAPNSVLSFQETLAFSDNNGLPLQVERVPVTGLPIIQNVTETSLFHCTQSGSMTQAGPNPSPPPPTFPGLFRGVDGSKQVTYMPVKAIRGSPYEYGVSWKYEFISVYPMVGGAPNYK